MRALLSLAITLSVAGCVSIPPFDNVSGVTPKTIVDTIECELISVRNKIEAARRRNPSMQSLCGYVAVADLSLQVDEQMVLAPSFSHTNVVSSSLTRVFDWGVKLDTQAQRTFSQSVTFDIAKLDLDKGRRCDRPQGGVSLNGNLGLEEVVEMAFATIDPNDVGIKPPDDSPSVGCPLSMNVAQPEKWVYRGSAKGSGDEKDGKKKNAFGTQIEFVILKNLNSVGPTFTLQSFKGPGKLFSTQRSDTHSVTIGFARAKNEAEKQNTKSLFFSIGSTIKGLQRNSLGQ